MRILVLGGYGQTGRPLVRHLLASTEHQLLIGGRRLERARSFAQALNDPRAIPMQVDARDPVSLKRSLNDVNLLVVACPTSDRVEAVVETTLESGADYLDVQLSEHKLEVLRGHEGAITARQLCFITEAGYHPGLPSALVRYAALQMDELVSAVTSCFLNMTADVSYTDAVDELVELFASYPTQVFKDGRWSAPGSFASRKTDFGAGFGQRTCYSFFLEELRALPDHYPALRETGLYMASTGWMLDTLTMAIFLALKMLPRASRRPLGRLLWWAMTHLTRPPHGVVLQVEASGLRGREACRHVLRLAHPDGYEFTAIPVVALLMQYDQVRRPGLHFMGHLCDPRRLVDDMQAMGIKRMEFGGPQMLRNGEGGSA